MTHFAGNMLQLANKSNNNLLVLSEQAYASLHKVQLACLTKYGQFIHSPLTALKKMAVEALVA